MRLRQLRIKGFKSFANDTILNFNEDVIGIVGPNGSGKSNIVDAIRWVLGEQKTRELRLEKMTDVIFNGTKDRKKAGVAQVTLDFENSKNILPIEYNNVSISRVLYRTGESEYRLNNVPCRLKDIHNLFRDTGIGSNSYAILALGMVDDLLADKENARRKMFEQAAGISKFKNRKKETLSKLKSTTADLDRVEDLLFEIESNIKSLERQARRAKKYLTIKEQYKVDSINLAHLTINEYKDQYKLLKLKIQVEEDEYRASTVKQNTLDAEIAKIQKKNLDEEIILSQKQKSVNTIVHQIREIENKKGILNQKNLFSKQNIQTTNQSVIRDTEVLNKYLNEKEHITQLLNEDKAKLKNEKQALHTFKIAYQEIKEVFDKTKQDTSIRLEQEAKLRQLIFDIEKNKAIYQNNIDTVSSARLLKLEEKDNYKHSYKQKKTESKLLKDKLKVEKSALDKILNKEEKAEKSKNKLKELILSDERALERIHRNMDAKQNEFNLLKSMIDNLEGYPESIKFLNKKWKKNAPVVSDLINCEEAYRHALEQYLEPYLNHYVVQNTKEAVQAIKLLTESQKGKAQFFLMDAIGTIQVESKIIPHAIPALSVAGMDSEYEQLGKMLLQYVYFLDEEKSLVDARIDEEVILLSKSGILSRSKYIIAGGSLGMFVGKKIGRKKSLKKIDKLLKVLSKDASDLRDIIQANQNKLSGIDSKSIDEIKKSTEYKIKTIEKDFFVIENKLKNHEDNLNRIKEKIEKDELQIVSYKELLKKEEYSLIEQRKAFELLSETKDVSHELESYAQKMSLASEQYNSANVNYIRQENKIENLEKDLLYRISRVSEITAQIERYKITIDKEKSVIDSISKEVAEIEKQLQSLYDQKEVTQKELSGVEQQYFEERQKIKEKEDKQRDLNRLLQTMQVSINRQKETYNDLKFKMQGVNERLKIEFNISVNDIINEKVNIDEKEDKTKLGEKVFALRTKIERFGEVNPMAVEAYDEMKSRYETITKQRDDILEARKSLESTIKAIEKQATEDFLSAFTKIRTHFIEVFRTLFTENDKCDLILLDEANPLESKIDIIAKPKGKRPQSLSQLSGGEKTLTATALLFALYLLKPAPFCIFDEIDAPLDDINIQKFNQLIKQFSKDSQFIIITHNKDTMTDLGTMYGIYMQEPGVSGISQVDFRSMLE